MDVAVQEKNRQNIEEIYKNIACMYYTMTDMNGILLSISTHVQHLVHICKVFCAESPFKGLDVVRQVQIRSSCG